MEVVVVVDSVFVSLLGEEVVLIVVFDSVLLDSEAVAARDPELLLDDIHARGHFCDGVLNLQPLVDLEESRYSRNGGGFPQCRQAPVPTHRS